MTYTLWKVSHDNTVWITQFHMTSTYLRNEKVTNDRHLLIRQFHMACWQCAGALFTTLQTPWFPPQWLGNLVLSWLLE